ncbi:MAG: hypothetical protein M1833_001925 [Piccolia ochrophora]|nr:MAG: hypothetical protein M1833_001925 [Piccolia ochrophora]
MRANSPALLSVATYLILLGWVQEGGCWGSLGHRTVAYLAEKHFSEAGASLAAKFLEDQEISDAAVWADTIRRIPKYQNTGGWHYIDAEDDPPRTCAVNFKRDCDLKVGCVVSAIVNMTARINDDDLSFSEQKDAFRFILHFIGDIHQPLHTENESRGGNDIQVRFGARQTNLHSTWDTAIPVKSRGGQAKDEQAQAAAWARELFEAQDSATITEEAGSCVNLTTAQDCALAWAGEANSWICKYVLKDDVEGVQGKDLGGEYYEGAVPIVTDMVAKAGFRLGAWVNGLAEARGEGKRRRVRDLGEGIVEL